MGEPPPPSYNAALDDKSNHGMAYPPPPQGTQPYPTQPGAYPPPPAYGSYPPPPQGGNYPPPAGGGSYPLPPPGVAYHTSTQQGIVTAYPPPQTFSNVQVVQGSSMQRTGNWFVRYRVATFVVGMIFSIIVIIILTVMQTRW